MRRGYASVAKGLGKQMSDVKIGVDLSELRELLDLLKEFKATTGGGMASGLLGAPGSGTGGGAIAGGPPTASPSVPAAALSPAAAGVVSPPTTGIAG
ncbi:hypothetical protein EON81_13750, partial [bacterium]